MLIVESLSRGGSGKAMPSAYRPSGASSSVKRPLSQGILRIDVKVGRVIATTSRESSATSLPARTLSAQLNMC